MLQISAYVVSDNSLLTLKIDIFVIFGRDFSQIQKLSRQISNPKRKDIRYN